MAFKSIEPNRSCNLCGSRVTIMSGYSPNWHRYNGSYICHCCYNRLRYSDVRNGGVEKNTKTWMGMIIENVIIKYFGISRDINVHKFTYNSVDCVDIKLNKIDVKSSGLICIKEYKDITYDGWGFNLNNKAIDNYVLVGLDINRMNVIKVWVIPSSYKKGRLTILFGVKSLLKYKKFELESFNIKTINEIYQKYLGD